jgi:hypothetical protein
MTNILIGIGGTGAKAVEAALSLFAGGLGPAKVHVGLVDQDRANGNVNRTQLRIDHLIEFQKVWGDDRAENYIDSMEGREDGGGISFGATRVQQLFDKTSLWCPEGDDLTLSRIIGQDLSADQKDLFDLLFMPGVQEQDLRLGEGYRGRAHVGAAALIAAMLDKNALIDRLKELMDEGDMQPVRIFLVGSAFGGTGAAGFPTLARELDRIRRDENFKNKGRVSIGGALMLPYFGFSKPDEDGQPVVTTDELLPKARLALEYYGRLFETEKTFDRFYVLGWSPFFNLGYHEAGNFEQRNPPLLPELFAATAAADFLSRPPDDAASTNVPVMLSARAQSGVGWPDFPSTQLVEEKLGNLLRFCAYWLYLAEERLHETKWLGSGNWTQKLRGRMKPVHFEKELETIRRVARDVLLWAAGMQKTAQEQSPAAWLPGPWDTSRIQDRGHEATPKDPVALAEALSDPEVSFDALVRTKEGDAHPFNAAAMFDLLVREGETLGRGNHKGYGKVAAAVYRAAARR